MERNTGSPSGLPCIARGGSGASTRRTLVASSDSVLLRDVDIKKFPDRTQHGMPVVEHPRVPHIGEDAVGVYLDGYISNDDANHLPDQVITLGAVRCRAVLFIH